MQDEIARTQTVVKDKYGELARQVSSGSNSGCCGSNAAHNLGADAICANLYDGQELSGLPEQAVLASLGCGNPTALAQLQPGQIVLDLGSGGGIDVLLSARRVGPSGKAYGLDMTEEQLDKILDVDKDAWEEELKGVEELYAKFGDHLPKELADELATVKANLEK